MCVCLFVMYKKKLKKRRKKKRDVVVHTTPRTNSFVCNICMNLKLSLSFFFFLKVHSLCLSLSLCFSYSLFSLFFGCIFVFFVLCINDALAFRFCAYYYYHWTFSKEEVRKKAHKLIHSCKRQINVA